MEEQISLFLMETISFYDYAENYYHGFLTGLLKNMAHYEILSNREAGEGRPDIMLKPGNIAKGVAVILELKVAKSFREMEEKCEEAVLQMMDRKYAAELRSDGYRNILMYGICFYKKNCRDKLSC